MHELLTSSENNQLVRSVFQMNLFDPFCDCVKYLSKPKLFPRFHHIRRNVHARINNNSFHFVSISQSILVWLIDVWTYFIDSCSVSKNWAYQMNKIYCQTIYLWHNDTTERNNQIILRLFYFGDKVNWHMMSSATFATSCVILDES